MKHKSDRGCLLDPMWADLVMKIEHLIRYAPRAVGLKPSASQGEARLRGLWRSNYSTTIRPRLARAKPACAGYGGVIIQRPYALG